MLTRLLVDRIICSDNQHRQIHARGAGKHVANESFMTGYVDDSEPVLADRQFRKS